MTASVSARGERVDPAAGGGEVAEQGWRGQVVLTIESPCRRAIFVSDRSTMGVSVGRKQIWDQTEVLAGAMRLFRRRGYLGASVRDIEEATGLHPGSLYRVFQ